MKTPLQNTHAASAARRRVRQGDLYAVTVAAETAARQLPAASAAIVAYRRQSRQASGSAPSLLALVCHLPQPS